jgi:hypothetical protein
MNLFKSKKILQTSGEESNKELQDKLDYWKKRIPEILLSPFNKNSWSILG